MVLPHQYFSIQSLVFTKKSLLVRYACCIRVCLFRCKGLKFDGMFYLLNLENASRSARVPRPETIIGNVDNDILFVESMSDKDLRRQQSGLTGQEEGLRLA